MPARFQPSGAFLPLLLLLALCIPGTPCPAAEMVLGSATEVRATMKRDPRNGIYRVEFEGVVLAYHSVPPALPKGGFNNLFVHDGSSGIYVDSRERGPLGLGEGQRVRISGTASPGDFAPSVVDAAVEFIGPGALPRPTRVEIQEMQGGIFDSQWVEVEGVVRSVTLVGGRTRLQLSDGRDSIQVSVTGSVSAIPAGLMLRDARVVVQGACGTLFNPQRQFLGATVNTAAGNIRVVRPPKADPFSPPARDINEVLGFSPARWDGHQIKVRGTVAGVDPGRALYLAGNNRALLVTSHQTSDLKPGDVVEALGFPLRGIYAGMLESGDFRKVGVAPLPPPAKIRVTDGLSGAFESQLVRIEARLLDTVQNARGVILVLEAEAQQFNAYLPGGTAGAAMALREGSILELTGICRAEGELEHRDHRLRPSEWKLLLRSSEDIQILQVPSWWTRERLAALLGGTGLLAAISLGAVVTLRKRVRAQTAQIARQIEEHAMLEERNRIARDLHDTLAQGFAGTVFQLDAVAAEFAGGPESARQNLDLARQMARHSLAEARRSVLHLRAHGLEGGLFASLSGGVERLTQGTHIHVHFSIDGDPGSLPPISQENLLRIGLEAVSNAVTHGRPANLWLTMKADQGGVRIVIRDDGSGFDPAPSKGLHFGLLGMEERARNIGAALKIRSAPGEGTTVELELSSSSGAPAEVPTPALYEA